MSVYMCAKCVGKKIKITRLTYFKYILLGLSSIERYFFELYALIILSSTLVLEV